MRCKGIAHIALWTWLAAFGASAQQVAHDVNKKAAPTKSAATAPGGPVQVASDPTKKNAPSPKGAPRSVVTKQSANTVQASGVQTRAESKQAPAATKPTRADRVSTDEPRSARSSTKGAAAKNTVRPVAPAAPKDAARAIPRPTAASSKKAQKPR